MLDIGVLSLHHFHIIRSMGIIMESRLAVAALSALSHEHRLQL